MNLVRYAVLGTLLCLTVGLRSSPTQPNVVFIVVDDLRPMLGCYGAPALTPNIDRLASRGLVFDRAYSQQALCNPSRASFLTGLRPDATRVYDLTTHFRQRVPEVVTLPQHFREKGYHTRALGKIFHPAFPGLGIGSDLGDPISWSVPAWLGGPRYYYSAVGVRLAREAYGQAMQATGPGVPNWVKEAKTRRALRSTGEGAGDGLDDWTEVNVRVLATEAPEVPDETLYDGQVAQRAVAAIRHFAEPSFGGRPFFLAVGFLRPHLPFVAPRKYWELYDPAKIEIAKNSLAPLGVPAMAMATPMNELLDTYPQDVRVGGPQTSPAMDSPPYRLPRDGKLTRDQQLQLHRGYLACVSYVDAQVGRVMSELERLHLLENTIVVFVGDHGFSLGEHGLWGKLTNFEEATRAPLIICAPHRQSPGRTQALVELLDIYPTICDLAGLPLPSHVQGVSLTPLWENPKREWKHAAFSQYPRGSHMGYSMRTDRYRFTHWQNTQHPGLREKFELYDHTNDPGENTNLAAQPEHSALVEDLSKRLRSHLADHSVARPSNGF
ncbi:MAG: sulfatase [Opitutaceae bacterium]